MAGESLPRVQVRNASEWRDWLRRHHADHGSIWVVTFRKGYPDYLPQRAIVEEALAFGWIDSLPRKFDESRTMLLLSPRKPGSNWSRVNRDIVTRLEAEGRMMPAGQAAVVRAKADGSWARLVAVDALEEPPDLAAALKGDPQADRFWQSFPPSSRRGILEWITNAKRPETRARRVAETVAKAARNIKANHPKGRDAGPRSSLARK